MGPGNVHFYPAPQGILTWGGQPYLNWHIGLRRGERGRAINTTSLSLIFLHLYNFLLRELGSQISSFIQTFNSLDRIPQAGGKAEVLAVNGNTLPFWPLRQEESQLEGF